ncbi:MAG: hypothetical protein U0R79_09335 [Propionicimonas sp.]
MRLVFAGTPQVAADTLAHLLDRGRHEVVAVLTRPDAPKGRSGRPVPSPTAALAPGTRIEVRPARAGDPDRPAAGRARPRLLLPWSPTAGSSRGRCSIGPG